MTDTDRTLVLVVEDDVRIQKSLGLHLQQEGYDVIIAGNGQEAMKMVELKSPDILLLDLMLPFMDGFGVLKELRAFSQVPVIAVSFDTHLKHKALELGADTFIPKPFELDKLIFVIKTYLK
jgi:DNA-binding response OmpR family regulator